MRPPKNGRFSFALTFMFYYVWFILNRRVEIYIQICPHYITYTPRFSYAKTKRNSNLEFKIPKSEVHVRTSEV